MRQRGDVAEKRQATQCRKDSFNSTSPPSRRSLAPVPEFFPGSWEDSYDGPMPATEQILNNGCLSDTQVCLTLQVRNLSGNAAGFFLASTTAILKFLNL